MKVVTSTQRASGSPRPLHGEIDLSPWKLEDAVVEQGAMRTIGWGKRHWTWLRFLSAVHNRLHPIFANVYLASRNPPESPSMANAGGLSVELWWRLTRHGAARQIAIVQSSGDAEFDIAAVESVVGALPIDVPAELADSLESAAIRWRFFSAPTLACTTYYAAVFDAPALPAAPE